jgi:hypothetical protein
VASLYRRAGHNTFPTYYRLNSRDRIAAAARGAGLELKELTAFANPDYFRFAGPALSVARLADQFLERLRFGLGRLYLVAVLQKPTAIRAVP